MNQQINAARIAEFLQQHPEFFYEHAELFANLEVPHPNQARAISLGERQIMVLRDRIKGLELRLATLSHQATFNESVAQKIGQWCARMLAENDATHLPGHVTAGLASAFGLSDVALRVWGLEQAPEVLMQDVTEDIKALADSLHTPYCGAPKTQALNDWLHTPAASMAVIALRSGPNAETNGLLVIGSEDPERYTEDMATDFLQTIGQMAWSALQRLNVAQG